MSEFSNELTSAQEERLAVLAEEMGEALQCIGKILRHGYESCNPVVDTGMTNRRELERELGHVDFAIDLLARTHDVSWANVAIQRDEKRKNISRWLHHQTGTREPT